MTYAKPTNTTKHSRQTLSLPLLSQQSVSLFYGRSTQQSGKPAILGLLGFAKQARKLRQSDAVGSEQRKRLQEIHRMLAVTKGLLQQLAERLMSRFDYSRITINPSRVYSVKINFVTREARQAAILLTDFDYIMFGAGQAKRHGKITNREYTKLISDASRALRRLFASAKYSANIENVHLNKNKRPKIKLKNLYCSSVHNKKNNSLKTTTTKIRATNNNNNKFKIPIIKSSTSGESRFENARCGL